MTIEIIDSNGVVIINPQGVEAEVGNPFPEVVKKTEFVGGVPIIALNSAPESKTTSSQES